MRTTPEGGRGPRKTQALRLAYSSLFWGTRQTSAKQMGWSHVRRHNDPGSNAVARPRPRPCTSTAVRFGQISRRQSGCGACSALQHDECMLYQRPKSPEREMHPTDRIRKGVLGSVARCPRFEGPRAERRGIPGRIKLLGDKNYRRADALNCGHRSQECRQAPHIALTVSASRVALPSWGNADGAMLRARNALMWA